MAFTPETKKMILDFLKDNPQLSSYQASDALYDLGIRVSYRTITEYRIQNKIHFDRYCSLETKIKADFEAGIEMTTEQIMKKYKCSRGHANKSIKEAKGIKPERRKNKHVVAAESKKACPLPVNTMDFYVQQLTANDGGRQVA